MRLVSSPKWHAFVCQCSYYGRYITQSRLLLTNTHIHLPNLWTGNTRELQLRTGCKKILHQGQCRKQANCQWKDGKCRRKAVRCRRITKKRICNANRNCEWSDAKCRTISIPPETTGGDPDPEEIPDSVVDEIRQRLEDYSASASGGGGGGLLNLCLCQNTHVPLVSKTVTAINDWKYGGNKCLRFTLATGIGIRDHCVCKDPPTIVSPAYFPEGGEYCECFN
jgi:hypothetical protein